MAEVPVTWGALIFAAGVVVGTVAWTYWFWSAIDKRISTYIREFYRDRDK